MPIIDLSDEQIENFINNYVGLYSNNIGASQARLVSTRLRPGFSNLLAPTIKLLGRELL